MTKVENALRQVKPQLRTPSLPGVVTPDDLKVNAETWASIIDGQLLGSDIGRVKIIPEGVDGHLGAFH